MNERLRLTGLGGDVLVNDAPIGGEAWLAPGDTVRAGRLRLTIGVGALRYRDPAGALLIGRRRARALPDALINNMIGFDGVPSEPAQPLPNPADVSRPAVFAILRRRNFTLLWLAQLISELGSGFTLAAASVLIYSLTGSALNTPDVDSFEGSMHPGAPLADAPVRHQGQDAWLLAHTGHRFTLLLFVAGPADIDTATRETIRSLADAAIPVRTLIVSQLDGDAPAGASLVVDHQGLAAKRLDARPGTAYLLRPDQHVAARWRRLDAAAVRAALARATCNA